jgi:hypothetical protein
MSARAIKKFLFFIFSRVTLCDHPCICFMRCRISRKLLLLPTCNILLTLWHRNLCIRRGFINPLLTSSYEIVFANRKGVTIIINCIGTVINNVEFLIVLFLNLALFLNIFIIIIIFTCSIIYDLLRCTIAMQHLIPTDGLV